MSKKSYMSLLKEAIAEFDTSDNVEVKGPMLDPILSWDGDGELPIYKDAASILERYYFNENAEEAVKTLDEADYENDKGDSKGESMKDAEGAGTEQAGTSKSDTIAGGKAEKEKEIAKEAEEVDVDADADEAGDEEEVEESTDIENAIIEKLIAEMEEDLDEADLTYTGKGPKEEMPKEKKATDSEEDTEGAGTEQAGTGTAAGQVPDRKDIADKLVKPKNYNENDEIDAALAKLEEELQLEQDEDDAEAPAPTGDEGDDDEDKELDVDKEIEEAAPPAPSAAPGGAPKAVEDEEKEEKEAYSEAFSIFKEAIEDDDEKEDDDDDDEKEEEVKEDIDHVIDEIELTEGTKEDMAADRKADMISVQKKCMRFKEIGQPDKYKACVAKGKAKLDVHYAKMKARFGA